MARLSDSATVSPRSSKRFSQSGSAHKQMVKIYKPGKKEEDEENNKKTNFFKKRKGVKEGKPL